MTPPSPTADIVPALMARFPGLETSAYRGQTRVVVGEPVSLEVLSFLAAAGFDLLVDVTCVDYL